MKPFNFTNKEHGHIQGGP